MITHSGIQDSGARLQIVPTTRKIKVPDTCKVIGVVGDHLSEQITIECPKIIDGHDIKNCAEHILTWKNADGELGHDALVLIGEDDDLLFYAWNVRGNTAIKAGLVSFSVHFEDYSGQGVCVYRWSTAECKECEVLDGVNALVGGFESVYVDNNTLVFGDHTPVRDENLLIVTPGVVPEGSKPIYTNGHHDVANFASVDVAVPTDRPPTVYVESGGLVVATDGTPQNVVTLQLSAPTIRVSEDGKVKSEAYGMTTEHKLVSSDDPEFISENIRFGKNIFGLQGTCPDKFVSFCDVQINELFGANGVPVSVHYLGLDSNGTLCPMENTHKTIRMLRGTLIEIRKDPAHGGDLQVRMSADGVSIQIESVCLVQRDDCVVFLIPTNADNIIIDTYVE